MDIVKQAQELEAPIKWLNSSELDLVDPDGIARLIAITTLKSVFSIQEIAQTLNTLQTQASSDQLYDAFVDYMNHGIDPENPIIQTSCQTVKLYHQTLDLILIKEEEEIQ